MKTGDPMTRKEKKMAAAMAAVSAFMQLEKEAADEAVAAASAPAPQAPRLDMNLWGMAGRQGMMQMRNLMQMKAFDRFR
jgi:hypothetical protein